MSSEFDKATALEPLAPGVYRGNVPDHWQQGKGAFGGVVVGLLARAMTNLEDSRERTLRSLTSDLAAPLLAEEVRVEVSTLRRGSNMTFAEARLLQKGAIVARASASFGKGHSAAAPALRSELPKMPPWEAVPRVPVELGPVFAQHYEYRSTGPLPFTGGSEPVTAGWIREKTAPEVLDEAAIAGLLDAWWPTIFSVEQT